MDVHSRRTAVILALFAVVLAIVAYSNALHGPFTFDDRPEIVDNVSVEQLRVDPLAVLTHNPTRPVVNISYAVDYAIWEGRDVVGFHLTNIALHVLNVLLLFVVVRRLARGNSPGGAASEGSATITAALAAALFAVHPIQTEAVSYVASRSELLVTAFFLGGVYSFRRAVSDGARWLAGAVVCFVLAVGSKETGGMLPFVLFASDVMLPPHGGWRSRFWKLHLPLMLLVLAGGAGRVWLYAAVENPTTQGFAWGNVAVVAYSWVRYLTLLFVPYPQSVVQAIAPFTTIRDPRIVATALTFLAGAALVVFARRRAPLATVGIFWFALTLLPSSVMILLAQVGLPMAEHRLYLPNCGFFLAVAALTAPALQAPTPRLIRRLSTAGGVAVLGVFLILTLARNRVWADPVRLWEEAAERAPRSPEAALSLAAAHHSAGDDVLADEAFNRAIALGPRLPSPYLGYATVLAETRQFDRAAIVLRLAAVRLPRDANVRLMLASIEERAFGDSAAALHLCQEALALRPEMQEATDCVRRNSPGRRK